VDVFFWTQCIIACVLWRVNVFVIVYVCVCVCVCVQIRSTSTCSLAQPNIYTTSQYFRLLLLVCLPSCTLYSGCLDNTFCLILHHSSLCLVYMLTWNENNRGTQKWPSFSQSETNVIACVCGITRYTIPRCI